jgi:glycosyltransferase involved in cell wall biosynthesis
MSDQPLVSILMPVLNGAQFLAEAVESVRRQTYSRWELLICDDGSTDASKALARQYAQEEPGRIRALAHPEGVNLGESAARNLGLRNASGDLIAMLDADDVWLPHKLEEQTTLLARSPAGVLVGTTCYWHSWTGNSADARLDWTPCTGFPSPSLLEPPQLLTAILRHQAAVPCTCSILARHDVVLRVGGFEDEFRRLYADQVFYAKLFVNTQVLVVDDCWDLYRQHPASMCATYTAAMPDARLRYLIWLRDYLLQCRAGDSALWAALRREIRWERYPRTMNMAMRVSHALSRAHRQLRRVV